MLDSNFFIGSSKSTEASFSITSSIDPSQSTPQTSKSLCVQIHTNHTTQRSITNTTLPIIDRHRKDYRRNAGDTQPLYQPRPSLASCFSSATTLDGAISITITGQPRRLTLIPGVARTDQCCYRIFTVEEPYVLPPERLF
jgi:hypothetical protein